MPIEFTGVIDQSNPLLRTDNSKKPLHLGNEGQIEVREPRGTPPGRWTRFKAALINLPLIGRLATIRLAGEEVRIARLQGDLRNDFHQGVANKFGKAIADRAFMGKGNKSDSPHKPLSAHRIEKIVNSAQAQAEGYRQQNLLALQNMYPDRQDSVIAECAALAALASPACSQGLLQDNEVAAIWESASRLTLNLERHGVQPEQCLRGALDAYADDLQRTPSAQRQQLAERCVGKIARACNESCNRAIIQDTFPKDIADAQHSPRGPYIKPDDAALVALLCAPAVGPNVRLLSEETARRGWQDLADVRRELRSELPDIAAERIDAAIAEVTAGRSSLTVATLREMAPKHLIEQETKRKFDPGNSESVFWSAVVEAAGELAKERDEEGNPLTQNPNTSLLLSTLIKEMMFDIVFGVDILRQRLGGNPTLPALMRELEQQIIGNVKQATKEHLKALDQIDQSRTLTPKQKQILKNYIAPPDVLDNKELEKLVRRMDSVQLRRLEAISTIIAARLPRMLHASEQGDPATLYDCVQAIHAAFTAGYQEILQHAGGMWVSRRFNDNAAENEILELCVKLALAGLRSPITLQSLSPQPAAGGPAPVAVPSGMPESPRRLGAPEPPGKNRSSHENLMGAQESRPSTPEVKRRVTPATYRPAAQSLARPVDTTGAKGKAPDAGAMGNTGMPAGQRVLNTVDAPNAREYAVRQLSYACAGSPSTEVVQTGMFYGTLLRVCTGFEVAVDVEAGAPEPLYRMRPELLVRTLADPNSNPEASQLDQRGVYTDLKFRTLLARDYNPNGIFDPAHHTAQDARPVDEAGNPLHMADIAPAEIRHVLANVLAEADVILSNTRLTTDDATAVHSPSNAASAFSAFFQSYGKETGTAILTCLTSTALRNFSADIEAAAFNPPVHLEHQRDVHEIWRNAQGAWYVRSTRVGHPRSQDGQEIHTEGVVLCTMTHRIVNPEKARRHGAPILDIVTPPKAVIMLTSPPRP